MEPSSAPHRPPEAVDTHFHVFAAHRAVAGARYVPAYEARFDTWQAQARAAGVARGVVVQTSFLGTDNSQLLACLDTDPQGLRGVAVVAPDADMATLRTLHAHGVRGVRLNLAGTGAQAWRADAPLWPLLRALGWHVELHTDVGALPALLSLVPADLPLVIDHMAKPAAVRRDDATVRAVRERVQAGAGAGSGAGTGSGTVWIKLSGAYRLAGLDPRALTRLWLEELGPQQLLWGSDWPCTNHEACADYTALFAALGDWLPDPAARHAALVENPQRLYWAA